MHPIPRTFALLPGQFSICRLPQDDAIPEWALLRTASFFAITQTPEELSIICPSVQVPSPDGPISDHGWHCLKLEGPFGMDEPGILASLVAPLAQAGISVFAEATYDTDYLLVKKIGLAISTLEQLGHQVLGQANLTAV